MPKPEIPRRMGRPPSWGWAGELGASTHDFAKFSKKIGRGGGGGPLNPQLIWQLKQF